jgi:aromatic-L-amino-acid/L-tryptophan decarboxylase
MDWAAKMFGLDGVFWNANEVGGGVFQILSVCPTSSIQQTTASDAALTAIVAARTRYLDEHPGTTLESLVIYVTTQIHPFGK